MCIDVRNTSFLFFWCILPLGPLTLTVSCPGPAPLVSTVKWLWCVDKMPWSKPGPLALTLLASGFNLGLIVLSSLPFGPRSKLLGLALCASCFNEGFLFLSSLAFGSKPGLLDLTSLDFGSDVSLTLDDCFAAAVINQILVYSSIIK